MENFDLQILLDYVSKLAGTVFLIFILTTSVYAQNTPLFRNDLELVELNQLAIETKIDTLLVDTVKSFSSLKGLAYSIIPGLLLHGSGHYLTGHKEDGLTLLKWSGIGLGALAVAGGGITLSGGSDDLMPVLLPIAFMGLGTFASTWIFDILGNAGIKGVDIQKHQYQETKFLFSYIDQDNNRNEISSLMSLQGQLGFDNLFIRFNYEREFSGDYNEIILSSGYRLLKKPSWQLYLIPEYKRKISNEGFEITQSHVLADLEINLGTILPSIQGLYLTIELGYGIALFQFDNSSIDFTNEIMIIGQGLRLNLSHDFEITSKYKRRVDEQIGGRDHLLFFFEHSIRSSIDNLIGEIVFTHGQGYRIKFNAGIAL